MFSEPSDMDSVEARGVPSRLAEAEISAEQQSAWNALADEVARLFESEEAGIWGPCDPPSDEQSPRELEIVGANWNWQTATAYIELERVIDPDEVIDPRNIPVELRIDDRALAREFGGHDTPLRLKLVGGGQNKQLRRTEIPRSLLSGTTDVESHLRVEEPLTERVNQLLVSYFPEW